jgi:hypothetical protein
MQTPFPFVLRSPTAAEGLAIAGAGPAEVQLAFGRMEAIQGAEARGRTLAWFIFHRVTVTVTSHPAHPPQSFAPPLGTLRKKTSDSGSHSMLVGTAVVTWD